MDTAKVSSKWQIVIPRAVRETAQIRIGSKVAFERTPAGILLRPVGAHRAVSARDAYGILPWRGKPASEADIRQAVREAAAAKARKARKQR